MQSTKTATRNSEKDCRSKKYFFKTFTNLPVRVHAAVRSNDEWKNKPELKNFSFSIKSTRVNEHLKDISFADLFVFFFFKAIILKPSQLKPSSLELC